MTTFYSPAGDAITQSENGWFDASGKRWMPTFSNDDAGSVAGFKQYAEDGGVKWSATTNANPDKNGYAYNSYRGKAGYIPEQYWPIVSSIAKAHGWSLDDVNKKFEQIGVSQGWDNGSSMGRAWLDSVLPAMGATPAEIATAAGGAAGLNQLYAQSDAQMNARIDASHNQGGDTFSGLVNSLTSAAGDIGQGILTNPGTAAVLGGGALDGGLLNSLLGGGAAPAPAAAGVNYGGMNLGAGVTSSGLDFGSITGGFSSGAAGGAGTSLISDAAAIANGTGLGGATSFIGDPTLVASSQSFPLGTPDPLAGGAATAGGTVGVPAAAPEQTLLQQLQAAWNGSPVGQLVNSPVGQAASALNTGMNLVNGISSSGVNTGGGVPSVPTAGTSSILTGSGGTDFSNLFGPTTDPNNLLAGNTLAGGTLGTGSGLGLGTLPALGDAGGELPLGDINNPTGTDLGLPTDLINKLKSALGGALGLGGTATGGTSSGPSAGSIIPGLLALLYANKQPGIDTSRLTSIYDSLGANNGAVVRAATDPLQQNIAAGYGDLLQSQALRGIRGSSFGDTDIANYISTTGRALGNAGANAAQGSLALQGTLAGNIATLQNQQQNIKNNLFGRAFDVLGRGLNPSPTINLGSA